MVKRVMLRKVGALSLMLVSAVCAREKAFYRIVSPVGSDITALSADGAVIAWTNAATDAVTCTVQRTSSLAPADWRDFVRHEATNTAGGAATAWRPCRARRHGLYSGRKFRDGDR